jgi:branched-chain amino acid transport system substrate-binding protein
VVPVSICLALVAVGCSQPAREPTPAEIRIGVSIELSGPDSSTGPAYRNALELVADQLNDAGGVLDGQRIRLVIQDNKSDPKESLARVQRLIEDEGVAAVVGGGTTTTTLSVVDAVEKAQVPLVSMGSSESIVTPVAERRYVFKTPPSPAPIVEVLKRDFQTSGVRRVGVLAVANAYGDSGVKAVRDGLARENLALAGVERFTAADRDYKAQLRRLIAARPDAIVVWSLVTGAATAARNLDELGYGGRVYFDAGAGAELFVRDARTAGEGVFMVHPVVLAANQVVATTPSALAQKEFFTLYTQRYGAFSGFASYSADALQLIVAAIEAAGSADRRRIRDALEKLSFDGLTGSYTFGPANHGGASGDALTVLTVRGGGWVLAQ